MSTELTILAVETSGTAAALAEFDRLSAAARRVDVSAVSMRASLSTPINVRVAPTDAASLATVRAQLTGLKTDVLEVQAAGKASARTSFFPGAKKLAAVDYSKHLTQVRKLASSYGTLAVAIERALKSSRAMKAQGNLVKAPVVAPVSDGKGASGVRTRGGGGFALRGGATTGFAGVGLSGSGLAAGAAIGGGILAVAGAYKATTADAELRQRLKLYTEDQREANAVAGELYDIAIRNRQALGDVSEVYFGVSRALKRYNLEAETSLNLTTAIAQATKISGGSSQGASAAITQLGQALSSGTLRGDELNSILEQAPRLAEAIAAGYSELEGVKVTVGDLKRLGTEGLLSAVEVQAAIRSQAAQLASESSSLQASLPQAIQATRTAVGELVADIDRGSGASKTFANAIGLIGQAASALKGGGEGEGSVLGDALAATPLGFLLKGAQLTVDGVAGAINGSESEQAIAALEAQAKTDRSELDVLAKTFREQEAAAAEAKARGEDVSEQYRNLAVNFAQQEANIVSLRKAAKLLKEAGGELPEGVTLDLPTFDLAGDNAGVLDRAQTEAALYEAAGDLSTKAGATYAAALGRVRLDIKQARAALAEATDDDLEAKLRAARVSLKDALDQDETSGGTAKADAIREYVAAGEELLAVNRQLAEQEGQGARQTFADAIAGRRALLGLTEDQKRIEQEIAQQKAAVGLEQYGPQDEINDRRALIRILQEEREAKAAIAREEADAARKRAADLAPADVISQTVGLIVDNAALEQQIALGREFNEVDRARNSLLEARAELGQTGLTDVDREALAGLEKQIALNEQLKQQLADIKAAKEAADDPPSLFGDGGFNVMPAPDRSAPEADPRVDRLQDDANRMRGPAVDYRAVANANPQLDAFDLSDAIRQTEDLAAARASLGDAINTDEGRDAMADYTAAIRERNEAEREYDEILAARDFGDQFAERLDSLRTEADLIRETAGLSDVKKAGVYEVANARREASEAGVELSERDAEAARATAEDRERAQEQYELASDVGRATAGTLGSIVTDFKNAEEYGKRFLDQLIQIVFEATVLKAIENAVTGGVSSIIAAESGGPATMGGTYLVAERGAEVFRPATVDVSAPRGGEQVLGLNGPGLFRPTVPGFIVPNHALSEFEPRGYMQPETRKRPVDEVEEARGKALNAMPPDFIHRPDFGGFRAMGGPVNPSSFYAVGENGPESFRPMPAYAPAPQRSMPANADSRASERPVSRMGSRMNRNRPPVIVNGFGPAEAARLAANGDFDFAIAEHENNPHSRTNRASSRQEL